MEAASTFATPAAGSKRSVVIGADRWRIGAKLAELWQYRELCYFLIWRDVKVRYAQSILGIGWAMIQPLVPMIIFTIVFGRVAQIRSDGIPYALFAYTALVPWTYFSNSLTDSSGSLVKEVNMLSKIYFPRLIIPLTSVLGKLIDLAISFALLFVLMVWYRTMPSAWMVIVVPFLLLLTMMAASGLGMWLSALALQYRDVKYGVPFAAQFLMYAAPVVYPTSLIPSSVRYVYALNPMVGVIEGFRACVVGTPLPWDLIAIAAASATAMLALGAVYFVRKEPVFADVA
jgi:homopolymeric O-antigen transport system permease protein